MLAKITSKNQITIPKRIMDQFPGLKYMEVEVENGVILLKPVKTYDTDLEKIRKKLELLNLPEDSVNEAVKWARGK
ncbi:MAG: AbrB/MazE/SpoVT family DNA-binding domain-containing protein [Desulfosalsimonas sp.]